MVTSIRLPDPQEVDELIAGTTKRSEMAERKLKKTIGNAWAVMSATDRQTLLHDLTLAENELHALLTRDRVDDPGREQLKKIIKGMQALDAKGLNRYPALGPATRALQGEEVANVKALATAVAKLMRQIAAGQYDTYVTNVFGSGHETDAKRVFKGAADALDRMKPGFWGSGDIVVDRMRKSEVWCCGALTSSKGMALGEAAVEGAADQSMHSASFLTMAHESTHALDSGATTDVLYEHHENFTSADPQAKLRSADCYKEVVRQIATGKTRVFVPGNVNPHLGHPRSNELRLAATEADKILNGAWVSAIRIHDTLHDMARNPGGYVGKESFLKNASILMGTSVHREASLKFEHNFFSPDTGPTITSGDLAAIDNKVAMLAACNGKASHVLVEPPTGQSAEENVRHVLRQVVTDRLPGLKFSKNVEKDVIVIRSLGELHESVNAAGKNLLAAGLTDLPEPMKSYRGVS